MLYKCMTQKGGGPGSGGWVDGRGEFVPEITTSVITLGLCYLVLSDSQNASKLDHTFYDTSSVFFFMMQMALVLCR